MINTMTSNDNSKVKLTKGKNGVITLYFQISWVIQRISERGNALVKFSDWGQSKWILMKNLHNVKVVQVCMSLDEQFI